LAGGRAFRFSCFAGFFSGNVRQVAFSGRSCRPAVKITCFNKLPLQSLPVRAPIFFSFLILKLEIRYSLLDIFSDFTQGVALCFYIQDFQPCSFFFFIF
jgi:hypothetical protein